MEEFNPFFIMCHFFFFREILADTLHVCFFFLFFFVTTPAARLLQNEV